MTLIPVYNTEQAEVVGANAVSAAVTVDTNGLVLVPGGSTTVAIVAAKTANTVVKASAGRLCRVLVQATVATAAILVYDSATTNSGTVIGAIPVGAAVGAYDFEMPAANGITVAGASTNPAMTVSFL
jgi:hypothetical protein